MAGLRLLLEDSGGATELAWPGGLQLASIDPGGWPPSTLERGAINSAGM